MIYFLDTSALVKKYIVERGTERIKALVQMKRDLAISRLATVELPAALARRTREGDIDEQVARGQMEQFDRDTMGLRIVELRPPVLELARKVAWSRALRAFDALQLAAALHLKRTAAVVVTFVAADGPLCSGATAEGLKVERLG